MSLNYAGNRTPDTSFCGAELYNGGYTSNGNIFSAYTCSQIANNTAAAVTVNVNGGMPLIVPAYESIDFQVKSIDGGTWTNLCLYCVCYTCADPDKNAVMSPSSPGQGRLYGRPNPWSGVTKYATLGYGGRFN